MTLQGSRIVLSCESGIAGDMTVAAMLSLGVPLDVITKALDAVGIGGGRLTATATINGGIAAMRVEVDTKNPPTWLVGHEHAHHEQAHHEHHHGNHRHAPDEHEAVGQPHRHTHDDSHVATEAHRHVHYAEIRRHIAASGLDAEIKRRVLATYDLLANAEARLHGKTADTVAFHEVGAVDAIVDIVAASAAFNYLQPASVHCARVAVGHGSVRCAHGVLPVPAPATLDILLRARAIVHDGGIARELCTPTGAAILAANVTQWRVPTGRPLAIGWGAGHALLADRPNCVRITAIEDALEEDALWELTANLDDMNPEWCELAVERAFAAGALDVWWTPLVMKKGRPAVSLSALVRSDRRSHVVAALISDTTTFGVRYHQVDRMAVERGWRTVTTTFGVIRIKEARDGDRVVRATPEYDDCLLAAKQANARLTDVYAAAIVAYQGHDK